MLVNLLAGFVQAAQVVAVPAADADNPFRAAVFIIKQVDDIVVLQIRSQNVG